MGGMVDNSPLLTFMQKVVYPFDEYKKRITITSANVNTGEYTEFDQTNLDFKDLPEAALCSASIPVVFPPHQWTNKGVFMDGGTEYNINLESAIRQCEDMGYEQSQIVIDSLFCGFTDLPETIEDGDKTWEYFFRKRDLSKYYHNSGSIAYTMAAHPDVTMRYVIKEVDGLGGLKQINFEGDFTWPYQQMGMQDA